MSQSKIIQIIKCILYELQPFRIQDAVALTKYTIDCVSRLSCFSLIVCEHTYTFAFEFLIKLPWVTWGWVIMWLAGWGLFIYADFGSLYILLSMIVSIFMNLGKRKRGEMSAYSVFNEGFKQLLGTLNAEQFDNEIRHNAHGRHIQRDIIQLDDVLGDGFDDFLEEPVRNNRRNRQNRAAAAHIAAGEGQDHADRAEDGTRPATGQGGARKKGKKARRNYEERMRRREELELQQEQRTEEEETDA